MNLATLILLLALAGALTSAWRARRQNHRLRAQLREGPLAYEACHAPSGADVLICPCCAFRKVWGAGHGPPPVYRYEIDQWWGGGRDGGEGLTCQNCKRLILPRAGGST